MLKILAAAVLTLLVVACAAPPGGAPSAASGVANSTVSGAMTAEGLGFHGPVDRAKQTDGPN